MADEYNYGNTQPNETNQDVFNVNYSQNNNQNNGKPNKFYKKTWFIILMLILFWPLGIFLMWKYANWNKIAKIIVTVVIGVFFAFEIFPSGGSDKATNDTSDATVETEATIEETTEATEEATTETQSEEDNAYEMGQNWFMMINWDDVFKYKSEVHYIMDYNCQKVNVDEFKKYGDYVATAGADLQNGFGAEFTSTVYIFMDSNGVIQHVFYDEADGSSSEIPIDQIPVNTN